MLSSQDMWDMPFSLPLADVAAREGDASEGRPRTVTHWAAHICYAIIALVFKIAFRYSTVGLGNLRRLHGVSGAVVACAHFSYLDPAFLWITARPKQWIRFMARDTIFGNAHGLAGQIVSRAAGFPVKRDAADRVAIKRAAAMLKRGEIVGIFPEGTRRGGKGSARISLHNGAAFIARMGKAPLVPAAVRNVDLLSPKGSKLPHFPKVTVVYGAPVHLEDFDFIPKDERLDAVSWYVMRECHALKADVDRESVDMHALFPVSKDYSAEFAGRDMARRVA